MLSIVGTYQNGKVELQEEFVSKNPVKVIITFLEDVQLLSKKKVSLKDFSFSRSQQNLENIKGSFADDVIEERRNDL